MKAHLWGDCELQTKRGYTFESETDTETIAKLVKHIYTQNPALSFRAIVEKAIQQFVSTHICTEGQVGHVVVVVCLGRGIRARLQESPLSRRSGCNAVSEYALFLNRYSVLACRII